MLFRQLEYFVALARERHFARAAAACYVSQPALSEAIRKLEHELNVPLVTRGHAFEGLTPEGERLIVWARRILADYDALEQEVSAMRSGLDGRLRFGVIATASTTAALIIEPFCRIHPLARVDLQTRLATDEVLSRLRRFELDAGVVHVDDTVTADLAVLPLYRERYVLVANRHLLTGEWAHRITWAELNQLPLCMLNASRRSRQEIDGILKKQGIVLRPHVESDSVASLYSLVGSGHWAGVVPQQWIHAFAYPPEISVVPIGAPDVALPVGLVTAASDPGSLIGQALVNTARHLALDELFEQLLAPLA